VPVLEWRRDVGEQGYLEGLARLVRLQASPGAASLLPNAG
jgi:hypothetical protein